MTEVAVAYVPVLHDGYRRFVEAHARDRPLYLIGPELYADHRPLAKDIRALDAALAAAAIGAWGVSSEVAVLDAAGAARLAEARPSITLPAEDVSYQVVDRWFPRCPVRYDTVFLRWDKTRSVALLRPEPARTASGDELGVERADVLGERPVVGVQLRPDHVQRAVARVRLDEAPVPLVEDRDVRDRDLPHGRRRMPSISPGRTSASFGPSRSPMCMYIWRMRSDVVTDACRGRTSIRPTNSSSSRWSASL